MFLQDKQANTVTTEDEFC